MDTPPPTPRFTREQLEAELAKVKDRAYTEGFSAELAKFQEEQRRRVEEARRLGNE
jgi:hypothetical protein